MTDIFEMFDNPIPEGYVEFDMKRGPKIDFDIVKELEILFKKHGITNEELAKQVATFWSDPPPWSPWVK